MTRARELSRLANSSALAVDSGQNVGIGSTTPDTKLDVAGIASAVAFYSDWTNVGYATVRSDLSVLSNLNVDGNVTIGGTQTVINTDVLDVADINIGIASTSSKLSNANLDGAGIKIYGSDEDKTLIWDNSNTRMSFNTDFYADNVFTTSAVVGTSATVDSQGIRVAGIITANSFKGDGSGLSGVVSGIEILEGGSSAGTSLTSVNFSGATVTADNSGFSTVTIATAGLATEFSTISGSPTPGITTYLDLSNAQDHKWTCSGIVTFSCTGGTEGDSHTVRIINSGITTVGFNTFFLWPSGSSPSIPTADGTVSLISFTVHRVGAGGTQLLAGASLNFS